jgi:hypothetical protein
MATNPFFQNYDYRNTQELIDDLVIESIQVYGIDTFYLTRSLESVDEILNEDDLSIFNAAYQFEVYVKSVDGFQGEGDFLSKFGLQIRDQVVLTVAIRTFERFVTRLNPDKIRPNEGDLIYLPLNRKFFKIMHVEHESVFYQSGALQVFDMKCELFEYSNERIETGIEEIDNHYAHLNTDKVSTLETLYHRDPIAKNIFFEEEGNDIINFEEFDPFTETISNPTNYAVTSDQTNVTADDTTRTADIV